MCGVHVCMYVGGEWLATRRLLHKSVILWWVNTATYKKHYSHNDECEWRMKSRWWVWISRVTTMSVSQVTMVSVNQVTMMSVNEEWSHDDECEVTMMSVNEIVRVTTMSVNQSSHNDECESSHNDECEWSHNDVNQVTMMSANEEWCHDDECEWSHNDECEWS